MLVQGRRWETTAEGCMSACGEVGEGPASVSELQDQLKLQSEQYSQAHCRVIPYKS